MSRNIKNESKEGLVLKERFKVGKKIGNGAFGDIYSADDLQHPGTSVAVKFESYRKRFFLLPVEHRAFQAMKGCPGFPECILYDRTATDLILVMELLGKNLKELFELCNKKFSIKTMIYIAIHTLTRIETLHEKNLIYRDIKPENFMIGLPGTEKARLIHLIDFGMAKEYVDKSGQHIPFREGKPITGTTRYMSRNVHLNFELSRRDDLESLGYMYLFLLKGSVPWSTKYGIDGNPVFRCQNIGAMKQALEPRDLFEGCPTEFADYLTYARNLKFEERPNYQALKASFASLLPKLNLVDDGVFDWDHLLTTTTTNGESNNRPL